MSSRRVIVFRSRLREGVEAAYGTAAEAVYQLASTMPGLLAAKDYIAEDGERLSIIEFDTAEHLEAWRDHADHQRAQQDGRDRWYAEYQLQICAELRRSRYDAATGTWERTGADPGDGKPG